jgi:PilZ domain
MDEKRRAQRHRALKSGSIRFNSDASIDCRVRNFSTVGACLEVASQIGIPDEFMLVIEHDHLKQSCHVIWRTATRLGVEFRAA